MNRRFYAREVGEDRFQGTCLCWSQKKCTQSGTKREFLFQCTSAAIARGNTMTHCAKAGGSSPVPTPSAASRTARHPRPGCGMSHRSWHARLPQVSRHNQRPAEVAHLPACEQPRFTRTLRQLFKCLLNLLEKKAPIGVQGKPVTGMAKERHQPKAGTSPTIPNPIQGFTHPNSISSCALFFCRPSNRQKEKKGPVKTEGFFLKIK